MGLAVEEMIRWVTPVKAFMRTALEHTAIRGVPIAAGESVLLSYPSGNRDEDIFDDPFRFDVSRDPNKHIAFGYGVHFCLGAALARMEASSFFSEPKCLSSVLRRTSPRPGTASSALSTMDFERRPRWCVMAKRWASSRMRCNR